MTEEVKVKRWGVCYMKGRKDVVGECPAKLSEGVCGGGAVVVERQGARKNKGK